MFWKNEEEVGVAGTECTRVERGPYKDGTVQVALWAMRSGIDFVLNATGSKKGALS